MCISWTTDFERLRAFYCARMHSRARGNNNNPVTYVRETRSWNKYDSGSRLSTRWPTLTARTLPSRLAGPAESRLALCRMTTTTTPFRTAYDEKGKFGLSFYCANKLNVPSIWTWNVSLTEIYYDAKLHHVDSILEFVQLACPWMHPEKI